MCLRRLKNLLEKVLKNLLNFLSRFAGYHENTTLLTLCNFAPMEIHTSPFRSPNPRRRRTKSLGKERGWGSGERGEGEPFSKGLLLPFPRPPEAFLFAQPKTFTLGFDAFIEHFGGLNRIGFDKEGRANQIFQTGHSQIGNGFGTKDIRRMSKMGINT